VRLFGAAGVGEAWGELVAEQSEAAHQHLRRARRAGLQIDVWDEARDERVGLMFSLGALGDAVSSYGTCRDRSPGSSTTTPGSSSRPAGAGRAPSLGRLRKLVGDVDEFRVTVAFGLVLAANRLP